jgi:hypothetical protein
LSALLILAACSQKEPETRTITETVVQTVTVSPNIPIQNRPSPVNLRDVEFFVVTEDNFEEFKSRFMSTNNNFVFVAVSIADYEDLSLNLADLQRYIEQQGSLIVYYEEALR